MQGVYCVNINLSENNILGTNKRNSLKFLNFTIFFTMKNFKSRHMCLWIDVDCFECQIWSLIHPELQNGPLLINTDSKNENDIASFNYQAKACGISRRDTIKSAKEKCPSLKVFKHSSNDVLDRTREKIKLSTPEMTL